MQANEDFKPFFNRAPKTRFLALCAFIRRRIDFQLNTIYSDIYPYATTAQGTVLDIGCGDCFYKYLLNSGARYIGMDIFEAENFDYGKNSDIVRFDGTTIPLENQSVDHIICSEVLEHVSEPAPLIAEMHRVLKQGGDAFITIPWSARFHYIPYDYARYTPSKLDDLFRAFAVRTVTARGTDITVICNKLVVAIFRQFYAQKKISYWKLPLALVLAPFVALIIAWAHCSLWFGWGSSNDPLGYTIRLKK
jgi:SAM-dependent methyltransferase